MSRFLYWEGHAAYMVQLSECLLFLLFTQRFSMPSFFILQERNPFALYGFGNDHRRRTVWRRCQRECLINLLIIVTIDNYRVPPKGFGARCIGGRIPSQFRFSSLPQAVTVKNGHQVVKRIVRGVIKGFPVGAFCHFAITE